MQRRTPLVIALVLALGLFGSALAASYYGSCTEDACYPFNATNSYVLQKAVTLAASSNAAVGDTVTLISGPNGPCVEKEIEWTVNHVPTLNSTHLTKTGGFCTTP
jgi:hypothetical protein